MTEHNHLEKGCLDDCICSLCEKNDCGWYDPQNDTPNQVLDQKLKGIINRMSWMSTLWITFSAAATVTISIAMPNIPSKYCYFIGSAVYLLIVVTFMLGHQYFILEQQARFLQKINSYGAFSRNFKLRNNDIFIGKGFKKIATLPLNDILLAQYRSLRKHKWYSLHRLFTKWYWSLNILLITEIICFILTFTQFIIMKGN